MSSPEPQTTPSETVRKHKEFLFPAVATYYQEPLALVRGEGFHVWDDQGNKYLDCFAGVLTVSVGHANPKVTEAIINQVKTIQHTSTLYANKPQSDLAEKLYQITPGKLKKSFFTNSGTEADDTAIHAAKLATGRHEIVVLRHSYSGRSATALSAMGHAPWRPLPAQVSGFVHAHAPYCYRCPFKLTYPECGLACANDIEELIMTTTTGEIAAFMAEPILGVGGFIVPPPGYFERAVEITRKHGGLFIADEVDLKKNAAVVGGYLRQRLDELKEKYSVIGDVRGLGLMQGLELVKDRETKEPAPQAVAKVLEETKRRGVLIGKGGLYGNVIRTGLMLNSTKDHVDQLIAALDAGFASLN